MAKMNLTKQPNVKPKRDHSTKVKVITRNESKIKIIGNNIFVMNGQINAYYILPMYNYSTSSRDGIFRSNESITSMLSGLAAQRPGLTFTIERISKIISADDVINNLLESIKLYMPDYDMPIAFTRNIGADVQDYCLLSIDIQQKELSNVEDSSMLDTIKETFNTFISGITNIGGMNIDEEKILDIEKHIYMAIRHQCVRATKDLVFYNFVSKLYPCYSISYSNLGFINEDNYEDIMGAVTQTVTDNFGWFEMHNEGVDLFGLPIQTTYGCMLNIKRFPEHIYSSNFPLDYPGCKIIIKCLSKEDARVKIKRIRAADRYELEQAMEAGAEEEQLEKPSQSIALATDALEAIDNGEVLCNFDCMVLVTGETKDEMRERVSRIISDCNDNDILIVKSLNQATDFLNHYVKSFPGKLIHMTKLLFPLSFQLNSGSIVGDDDRDFQSPSIGIDLQ